MSASSPADPFIFLGIPAYGGIVPQALDGLALAASKYRWHRQVESTSATGQTFNTLWCRCLSNRHRHGFTHFAMHHADIAVDPDWLDVLLDEMVRVGADVLSVTSPIKDHRGLTSSGWMHPETRKLIRFTMREIMQLPETFDAAGAGKQGHWLMVNTALWIARLDHPWVEEFPGFNMLTGIKREEDGSWGTRMFSEDWNWSSWLGERGDVRVFQTRKVGLAHYDGNVGYRNDHAWGEWDRDYGLEGKPTEEVPAASVSVSAKEPTREIVAVRYAEDLGWVHGWLDDILVKHGPNLTYRIYDKGPGGETPNIGNLDWTYLWHIVTRWDELADWTVFTQADPFPHLVMADGKERPFEYLLGPTLAGKYFPFVVRCREWGEDGRLHWHKFEPKWRRAYENGTIHPAKLSFRDWCREFIGVDIEKLGHLEYHPGAIFGVSREMIHRRPKAFYERLMESLGEGGHRCPETAHYAERVWSLVFQG